MGQAKQLQQQRGVVLTSEEDIPYHTSRVAFAGMTANATLFVCGLPAWFRESYDFLLTGRYHSMGVSPCDSR